MLTFCTPGVCLQRDSGYVWLLSQAYRAQKLGSRNQWQKFINGLINSGELILCAITLYTGLLVFIGRPFVKRFDLCYWTVVLYVLSVVCNVGVLWRNGWMDQDEIWYGDRPQSRPHYVRWGSSSPHQKEAQLHNFRLMSIVAKRSPISATAELLYRPCTVLTCVCLCVCVCVLVCFSLCVIIVFF